MFKEELLKYGYEQSQYDEIMNLFESRSFVDETFAKRFIEVKNYLESIKFSKEEIIECTTRFPMIFTYSKENIENKINGMKRLGYSIADIKAMLKSFNVFGYSLEKHEKKIETLTSEYKYTFKDILKITKRTPSIMGLSIEYMKERIEEIEKLGFEKQEVVQMTKINSKIFTLSMNNIKEKMVSLKKLNYNDEEINKILSIFPILFNYPIENLEEKFNGICNLGFSPEEVKKITIKFPSIYGLSIEKINEKFNFICNQGYSKSEVKKMITQLPSLIGLDTEKIKTRLEFLRTYGFDDETIHKMTTILPAVFAIGEQGLKERIDFYDSANLRQIIEIDPKQLIQGVKLSYARYNFYKDNGIDITMDNYKKLFINQSEFIKNYKLSNDEIIEKYDYKLISNERKK